MLENDEWGWLMEPRRNISRVKMPAAVSPNEYKHTESLPHRIMQPTSEAVRALQRVPLPHSVRNL